MNRIEAYRRYGFPFLKRFDPETVHERTIALLEAMQTNQIELSLLERLACIKGERFEHPSLQTHVAGLELENPIMLGAGFDKNGRAVKALYQLGFSSIEVGTVTLFPQEGNPRPRLYHIEPESLLNHMGFPGRGADVIYQNLLRYQSRQFPLGVSLGINADIDHADAARDLGILAHLFSQVADYLVLNISSPNTANLVMLQHSHYLEDIIVSVSELSRSIPLLLKVSPDLTVSAQDRLLRLAIDNRINGLIAANTSTDYSLLSPDSMFMPQRGGLSGKVIQQKSTGVLKHLYQEAGGQIDLIGSGGVMSLDTLLEKFSAGAKAVSVYSGLVFGGPAFASNLNQELAQWLSTCGTSLDEIIGQPL